MTHKSENAHSLKINTIAVNSLRDILTVAKPEPQVLLFLLHSHIDYNALHTEHEFIKLLKVLSDKLVSTSVICFIAHPAVASTIAYHLQEQLDFKLWISLKLNSKIKQTDSIPNLHHTLLIFTKYKDSLKHTKTRIAYTYCPVCNRTTKDYGGKKHLYHEYGTLMSDVWRDIEYNPTAEPDDIVNRIADVFGLPSYNAISVIDLRNNRELQNYIVMQSKTAEQNVIESITLKSELINSDCLSALKSLPSNSMEFCFADPPYNLVKKYNSYSDDLDIVEYFNWCDQWIEEIIRVLKPGRFFALLNIPQWCVRHFYYLNQIATFHQWITWEGLSLPVRQIMPANYSIICFSKGDPIPAPGICRNENSYIEQKSLTTLKEWYCLRQTCVNARYQANIDDREPVTDLWWDIHRLKHNSKRLDHPCQLPPDLMRRLISLYSNENDCVLDPFNGIGTTTLVAHEMNRKYMGIEKSTEYHQLALKRHQKLNDGVDPFAKTKHTPSAKNSRVKRIKKQKYLVSKKELQLEVKEISKKIGKIPNRDDVEKYSKYPIDYFDEYFIDWGEVCAAAKTTGMIEFKNSPSIIKKTYQQTVIEDLFDV